MRFKPWLKPTPFSCIPVINRWNIQRWSIEEVGSFLYQPNLGFLKKIIVKSRYTEAGRQIVRVFCVIINASIHSTKFSPSPKKIASLPKQLQNTASPGLVPLFIATDSVLLIWRPTCTVILHFFRVFPLLLFQQTAISLWNAWNPDRKPQIT